MDLKDTFKKCMAVLYPGGVHSPEQVRDLVRCYTMAWGECFMSIVDHGDKSMTKPLRALACTRAITSWREDTQGQGSKDWMPDASWQWWGTEAAVPAPAVAVATEGEPKVEEHHITMIDGVELKDAIALPVPPQCGGMIPHLGPITKVHCYHRTEAVACWTVQTN